MPASFRSYIASMGYNGVICYPSFNNTSIEGCSQNRIEKLSESIDSLSPFEEKRDIFATSVLSESVNLNFDSEGRVSIPDKLLNHAKIRSTIVFVGLGKVFQMWDPKTFENFKSVARKKSYINRSTLKWYNRFKKEGV